jgi:hypothetical protein
VLLSPMSSMPFYLFPLPPGERVRVRVSTAYGKGPSPLPSPIGRGRQHFSHASGPRKYRKVTKIARVIIGFFSLTGLGQASIVCGGIKWENMENQYSSVG